MSDSSDTEKQLKEVNESVYKHSLELAVKNKTLLLLSNLYEIATLALEGKEMAVRMTRIIQEEFEFEAAGLLTFDVENKALDLLAFTVSERVAAIEVAHGNLLEESFSGKISHSSHMHNALTSKQMVCVDDLLHVCGEAKQKGVCTALSAEGFIHSSLIYPLIVNNKIVGVLLLCLNRGYKDLVKYEQEAIQSFVGVIAIALDKVLLYEELGSTNAKLRDLDQQKNEFLSFASHQLRTPLTAIKWSAGAMLDGTYGALPKEIAAPVRTIFEESSMMALFINDYLNVSRIEQGRMEYRFAPTNMVELLTTTAKQLEQGVKEKGLTLTLDVGTQTTTVWADPSKLTQVVSNLIDNAIKYTQKGGITISLRTLVAEGKVRVEIKDTGIGMDKETLGIVFNKFVRGENAKVVNGAGSGLGLFIVKTFVEAHKGTIRIDSEGIEKGTMFIIDFPLFIQK